MENTECIFVCRWRSVNDVYGKNKACDDMSNYFLSTERLLLGTKKKSLFLFSFFNTRNSKNNIFLDIFIPLNWSTQKIYITHFRPRWNFILFNSLCNSILTYLDTKIHEWMVTNHLWPTHCCENFSLCGLLPILLLFEYCASMGEKHRIRLLSSHWWYEIAEKF